MKAWEIRNGMLGLHDVEEPTPSDGQVLIHVRHAGLCGSDLPKLLCPGDFALPEPWRPGHEITGTDTAGRAIAIDPLVPCRTCTRCTDGTTHLCPDLRRIGWDLPGGFAEQVAVPVANARPLPDDLDLLTAVLADPAAVAVHGLRCNDLGPPGRLAIIGAGAVGLLTALYANQQRWTATVLHRHGRAPYSPVVEAIPVTFQSIADLLPGEPFDAVVDAATGTDPAPLEIAVRLVRDGGAIIVQNAYHPGVRLPVPLRNMFRRSIRLIGSFSYCQRQQPDDFTQALDLLRSHATQAATLITQTARLADLPATLRSRSTRAIRQVVTASISN
jgi:threonine dehydrogenase-like Zn-dependent dehydrogenase